MHSFPPICNSDVHRASGSPRTAGGLSARFQTQVRGTRTPFLATREPNWRSVPVGIVGRLQRDSSRNTESDCRGNLRHLSYRSLIGANDNLSTITKTKKIRGALSRSPDNSREHLQFEGICQKVSTRSKKMPRSLHRKQISRIPYKHPLYAPA